MADHLASQIKALVEQGHNFVRTQSDGNVTEFVQGGQINADELVPTFLASLAAGTEFYSHYVALGNDDFLQVIAIHGDALIQAALQAPASAHYAVRTITHSAQGLRQDSYVFLDRHRNPVGQREQPAKLVPTQRPWYAAAMTRQATIITEPYVFASNQELGLTLAAPLPEQRGVVGADISLRSLQGFLHSLSMPPNGAIALLDQQDRVLAFDGRGPQWAKLGPMRPMTALTELAGSEWSLLRAAASDASLPALWDGDGQTNTHVVSQQTLPTLNGKVIRLVVWAPLTDFGDAFAQTRRNVWLMALGVLLLLLPLNLLLSHRVARSLGAMAKDAKRLKRLDFSQVPHRPKTVVYEVNTLGHALGVMYEAIGERTRQLENTQAKLSRLIDSGIELASEQSRDALLKHILQGARDIAHCQVATLFLKTDHQTLSFALRTNDKALPMTEIPLFDDQGQPNTRFVVVCAALEQQPIVIDDVYAETRFDLSGTKAFSEASGLRTVSMLTVPLSPRQGEVVGVIQMLNALDPVTGAVVPFDPELLRFVQALAAQSAVALENRTLIESQRLLMDGLIKLVAGAIDAKSPYTGGHCARVPELGVMLAKAACNVTEGPLADFNFQTEDEWREFEIGAWLHDCGKMTTPEYVVDKATKLETIYNRIHEIRTRFEVLLRDARIAQLQAVTDGVSPEAAQATFEARQAELHADFAFLAACNVGSEFLGADKVAKVREIGSQTWTRHFDDRLGLSQAELARYPSDVSTVPVQQTLLMDAPQHRVERSQSDHFDPQWGFKMNVPELLYNHGELHNLTISAGTLTPEERFKINEHVMHTLMMLKTLPLPKNLQRVPDYAATHHETLTGGGYPRRLGEAELSIPMRILAIADVFEALTASDRPYKSAKTLSESIKILASFKRKRHIDPDLFDLFLTSGIYLQYAEKFLAPEQIDTVDIAAYLG